MADVYKLTTNELIDELKTGITGINNAEEYRNQFSANSNYQNRPPEVFVEFNGTNVISHSADQEIAAYAMQFVLYVVAVDIADMNSLIFLQRVVDFIDGRTITPAGVNAMKIIAGNSKLLGYLEGGAKIFTVECDIY